MQVIKQKSSTHGLRNANAFTFAEVVVSVFILLIAVIALFTGFTNGYQIIDTTREDLRATQILTQKTEAIRLLRWSDQLPSCPKTFQESYYPLGATNAGVTFYGTIDATGVATNIPDSASYKSDIYLVTVTVTWTNYIDGGKPVVHTREVKTLAAKNGIQNYIWGAP